MEISEQKQLTNGEEPVCIGLFYVLRFFIPKIVFLTFSTLKSKKLVFIGTKIWRARCFLNSCGKQKNWFLPNVCKNKVYQNNFRMNRRKANISCHGTEESEQMMEWKL